jgi:glycerol-3-phosphate O-acyltransferase
LVACLMVKRRRSVSIDRLSGMIKLIFPYLAAELSYDPDLSALPECLAVMTESNLLSEDAGLYSSPGPAQPEHLQLTLLANLVSQTLERMFIVIHQLAQTPSNLADLRKSSQLVAQRISRLYGINAPEFSDQRLFDQFIDSLMQQGMLHTSGGDDGTIDSYDPMVESVLRAAEFVIDPQIRHGVLSANNHI